MHCAEFQSPPARVCAISKLVCRDSDPESVLARIPPPRRNSAAASLYRCITCPSAREQSRFDFAIIAMDFLKSAVASAMAKGPPFPYNWADRVDIDQSVWTMYNGTRRVRGL
jgi:hypothetical protein